MNLPKELKIYEEQIFGSGFMGKGISDWAQDIFGFWIEEYEIVHEVGDPYFMLKADEKDWKKSPQICAARLPKGDMTEGAPEDGLDRIHSIHVYPTYTIYQMWSGKEITEEAMKKNQWFWLYEKAEERTIQFDMQASVTEKRLKKGDKLTDKDGKEYKIISLEFGSLFENYETGINMLTDDDLQQSNTEFFDELERAWYLAEDENFSRYVVIGGGTDGNPYMIEHIPRKGIAMKFHEVKKVA